MAVKALAQIVIISAGTISTSISGIVLSLIDEVLPTSLAEKAIITTLIGSLIGLTVWLVKYAFKRSDKYEQSFKDLQDNVIKKLEDELARAEVLNDQLRSLDKEKQSAIQDLQKIAETMNNSGEK